MGWMALPSADGKRRLTFRLIPAWANGWKWPDISLGIELFRQEAGYKPEWRTNIGLLIVTVHIGFTDMIEVKS